LDNQRTQAAKAKASSMSTQEAVAVVSSTEKIIEGEIIAKFEKPRLPWHPQIEERFGDIGVTRASWKVLVEAIWPRARMVDSVIMALAYCQRRKLDPFKRVVHIVSVWDSAADDGEGGRGGYVETIWPGIAELRTTAFRTGQYAGCDETVFGPMVTRTFKGEIGRKNNKRSVEKTVTFPEWAQVTITRVLDGKERRFAGPKTLWLETYATMGGTDVPNEMWTDRASGQIEKCAEAGALRKAFPEELGNELTAEEMEGRRIHAADQPMRDVTPKPKGVEAPPPPAILAAMPKAAATPLVTNEAVSSEAAILLAKEAEPPAPREAPAPPGTLKKQPRSAPRQAASQPAKEAAKQEASQAVVDTLKASVGATPTSPIKPEQFDEGKYIADLAAEVAKADDRQLNNIIARDDPLFDRLSKSGKLTVGGLFSNRQRELER
jgi:phage recombination protein Bet